MTVSVSHMRNAS